MTDSLTHAGAVAYRTGDDGTTEFLIVSSSNGFHWVLPKGHIGPDETPEDTTRRELLEEAGVTADILAPLTSAAYEAKGETVRVRYYLARATATGADCEDRLLRWLDAETAHDQLTFDDARAAMRQAAEELNR